MPPQATASTVLFENVGVFDGRSDNLLAHRMNVLVKGNKIERMTPEPVEHSPDASECEVIDGAGRVLMPGLIDLHVHPMLAAPLGAALSEDREYLVFHAAAAMEAALLRGFTSIRDAGGASYGLARASEENLIRAPRIFHSGAILSQTAGHGDFRRPNVPRQPKGVQDINGIAVLADGADEVRQAARENLRLGATQIKIMAGGGGASPFDHLDSVQLSDDEMRAAVDVARDWGTYVFAHAYTDAAILRCIRNGVRSI
jgi:imidazolonepropionase-like amidohydrolase